MRAGDTLWKALAAARRSNLAAAGDRAPVPACPGATRRALLKAMLAAGAVAALPRPARAAAPGRVAIVGGGIAGLSALHHLRRNGIDACLYEGRRRTGGRILTQRPAEGPAFEAGAQLVNTDHDDMHALIARFGLKLIDRKEAPHRTLILANGTLIGEEALAEGLRPIAAQIGVHADWLDRDHANAARILDGMSIRGYLDRHSHLIAEPWIRRLLEESARTEYGVEPDRASAIELIFNLPTVNGERAEVLGGADERLVIEGGSSALIAAMTDRHAARIALGRQLRRIDRADKRGQGPLRLHFMDGSMAEADTLILALPAPVLRQIEYGVPIDREWQRFIAEMELGTNEKVQAAAGAMPWQGPMGTGGELWQADEQGYSQGWDGSVHLAGRVDPIWTWYLGGAQAAEPGAADELARRFAQASEHAIPGLIPAVAQGPWRRTGWRADPFSQGGYVNYPPGQLTRFGGLLWLESDDPGESQVARSGDIFFAGEHLSDAYPGYMNGAAQTGRLAAEAIAGRRLPPQSA
ncbi:FAD-dependent oxidoreductase [Sphingomonas canadensis]|nr:NAD(P)/FAD-dependent oxidoreductase [Sphingomonas canadensis]MCW3834863.1 FAD-dependent oxidoreductase [Sphingomonas canadensis]